MAGFGGVDFRRICMWSEKTQASNQLTTQLEA
jgi:hypothetical protein